MLQSSGQRAEVNLSEQQTQEPCSRTRSTKTDRFPAPFREEAEEVLADLIQQDITLACRIIRERLHPERTACEERLFSDSQRSGARLFSSRRLHTVGSQAAKLRDLAMLQQERSRLLRGISEALVFLGAVRLHRHSL